MTHMLVQVPARITRAPRAAEPLANAALAAANIVSGTVAALVSRVRSRHLPAQGTAHAGLSKAVCTKSIGANKG